MNKFPKWLGRAIGILCGIAVMVLVIVFVSGMVRGNNLDKKTEQVRSEESKEAALYPYPDGRTKKSALELINTPEPYPAADENGTIVKMLDSQFTPTATLIPTPLPVSPSAYAALWVDNYVEGNGASIWWAKPEDIAAKKEIANFEKENITSASLSPDKAMIAVTTKGEINGLWVMGLDGKKIKKMEIPVEDFPQPMFWTPDSQLLSYGLKIIDVNSGKSIQTLKIEKPEKLLGYSVDGNAFYYLTTTSSSEKNQSWNIAVVNFSDNKNRILCENSTNYPNISPDKSKYILLTEEDLSWTTNIGSNEVFITKNTGKGFTFKWLENDRGILFWDWDNKANGTIVNLYDLKTGRITNLATLSMVGKWKINEITPDNQWMAAENLNYGMYLIHLATGELVHIPDAKEGKYTFVGWIPSD